MFLASRLEVVISLKVKNVLEIEKKYQERSHVLDILLFLERKIKQKEPASLVRLGDAEGRFLGYPELVSKEGSDKHVLDYVLELELGRTDFSENALHALSLQIRAAVKGADIIGLPREAQYKSNKSYHCVFDAIERFGLLSSHQLLTDAAIHRYLQFGLFYRQLLQNMDYVGVVTGRSEFAGVVQQTFGIDDIVEYLVPAEAIHPGKLQGDHFPDRFYALKEEIKIPYRGAVFLVGAGYLGKIYCQWIKDAGGIAIDVGSICDSWTSQGRLQHDYHKIKHYNSYVYFTLENSVRRFNEACDNFSMDSYRLTQNDLEKYQLASCDEE